MTKKEQFELAMAICEKYELPEGAKTELSELLKPKSGGQTINLDEIVIRDSENNITHLKCRLSGVILPADLVHFTADKGSKIVNAAGEELFTISRQAQVIKREHIKSVKASIDGITTDLLDGNIDREDAKAQIEDLKKSEPDYSSVIELIEDTEDTEDTE